MNTYFILLSSKKINLPAAVLQEEEAAASDYGGMEVFRGATIGHTDPWEVIEALETAFKYSW